LPVRNTDGRAATPSTYHASPPRLPPAAELLPELENRFGLVLVRLPSGSVAPLERLAETKRRMHEIERSPEAMLCSG
jgi:hypothetical protein